jgi:hypothetical protein
MSKRLERRIDQIDNPGRVGRKPDFTDDELIALLQAKRRQRQPDEGKRHGESR